MTGKARWVMPEREFAGVGMTGEPLAPAQKEKASLRRVRSAHLVTSREQKYTPKKKKQVCGVCGAPISPLPESESTRQKEKASLRRVRSAHQANVREQKHPPKKKKQVCDVCGAPISPTSENKSTRQKRKSKFVTCAERPASKRQRTKAPA